MSRGGEGRQQGRPREQSGMVQSWEALADPMGSSEAGMAAQSGGKGAKALYPCTD